MDIRIEKNKLLKGLYLAHGIADRKSTMPILANRAYTHGGYGSHLVRCHGPQGRDSGDAACKD